MGVAERRAREKEQLRQSILDAASQLVVEEGHQNLSIRKIADRIEYAPSTIYLYFQDKFEILASICIEMFQELTRKLQRIEEEETDPMRGLRQGLRCYINFGLSNPSHYQVTFMTPMETLPEDHPGMKLLPDLYGLEALHCLQRSLQRAANAGLIRTDNLMATTQSVWLMIHGITSALVCMGKDEHFPWVPHEQLIEHHLDIVMRGLTCGAPGVAPGTAVQ
jgi:AcrR family transcriptional regulator